MIIGRSSAWDAALRQDASFRGSVVILVVGALDRFEAMSMVCSNNLLRITYTS